MQDRLEPAATGGGENLGDQPPLIPDAFLVRGLRRLERRNPGQVEKLRQLCERLGLVVTALAGARVEVATRQLTESQEAEHPSGRDWYEPMSRPPALPITDLPPRATFELNTESGLLDSVELDGTTRQVVTIAKIKELAEANGIPLKRTSSLRPLFDAIANRFRLNSAVIDTLTPDSPKHEVARGFICMGVREPKRAWEKKTVDWGIDPELFVGVVYDLEDMLAAGQKPDYAQGDYGPTTRALVTAYVYALCRNPNTPAG